MALERWFEAAEALARVVDQIALLAAHDRKRAT
jgi:hypothetical protein